MSALLPVFRSLAAAALVLWLPGIAFAALIPDFWKEKDFFERLADATGLSLGLTALAGLGFFLAGLRVGAVLVLAAYGLLGMLAVLGFTLRIGRRNPARSRQVVPELAIETAPARRAGLGAVPFLLLALVFTAITFWRFYQVRTLVLPAWVDSVHHVLVVRVMLEKGSVPADLSPYLPVPFYYHFAFHALAAVFSFLAELSPEHGVLVFGQALNAAVALSIYRLGKVLWRDWRAAGLAALLCGFVSQMPAYYATWGRYTLLTGLVLLPLSMAAALEIAHQGAGRTRLAQLAVLTAGLLLAHYFAALLLALFLALLAVQAAVLDRREGRALAGSRWLALAVAALAGALLASPWLARAVSFVGEYVQVGTHSPTQAGVEQTYFRDYLPYLWRLLGPTRSHLLLLLAPLGLVPALLRPSGRTFAAWALLLGLLSLPWGVYITPFRPDHAVIVLFLPATLLVGGFFLAAYERLKAGRLAVVGALLVSLAVAGLLAWGLRETRSIVNASTVLAGKADLRALRWIEHNTPPEARFLINVTHWQYGLHRGVDGGWWITPLTGRQTLLPPALFTQGERDYTARINRLAAQASRLEGCTREFWELVREAGLTHIYVGRMHGPLRPEALEGCPGLRQVYAQEGVSIYRLEGLQEGISFP